MTGLTRASGLALAAFAALLLSLGAPLAGALAAATPQYTKENQQAFEHQLSKGDIKSATFNKKLRSLHVELKDGSLFLYRYPKKGEPKLAAQLKAKHVLTTILKPSEAAKEAKAKRAKHKL